MTSFLTRLIGRIPIGWLQLTHNKGRLFAAVAGISFANLLVFVQLGIMFGLNNTIQATYDLFDSDVLISAVDANTLSEGSHVPRQLMYRALSAPTVLSAAPLFLGANDWTQETDSTIKFQIIGLGYDSRAFVADKLRPVFSQIQLPDLILLDTKARGLKAGLFDGISVENPLELEIAGRMVKGIDTISVGGGFTADGTLLTSDQTFLDLFPRRLSRAPNHIMVKVKPGIAIEDAVSQLQKLIPPEEARVRSFSAALAADQHYQTTQRPVGLIFGFGVLMGTIVGIVIVYQILSTDVADHIREYATFKAMGYPQSFFLGIVFEEAIILAVLGFLPGFGLSWLAHIGLAHATGLPVYMGAGRSVMVFLGTVMACSISGGIATRRLAGADPADLF